MQKNKVYITSYSSITALGIGNKDSIDVLSKGKSPIHFPGQGERFKHPQFRINKNLDVKYDTIRNSQISLNLLSLVEEKIKDFKNVPLYMASSTGGIKETEEVYKDLVNNKIKYSLFKNHFYSKTISDIKDIYKDKFSDFLTFSTACSSSGHSILHAARFIQNGIYERAVVIGVDSLALTALIGFDSLKLVSHTGTKPLTFDRDGISLGEGGGILILDSNPGSSPCAEISGCFSNSDGYHISSPNPEGDTQKACILNAIKNAEIAPEDIQYISAHGTGTVMNDEIELKTIQNIFTENTAVTSLKSFIGHTLGASAIAEIALTIEMLKRNKIYQPLDFKNSMDEKYIPSKTIEKKVNYFLKNSFGFGGNNVSIVVKLL
jgi:3-oxoacyl-[acyl-carrier-protein] synthase I